jgi:hypothetical protein
MVQSYRPLNAQPEVDASDARGQMPSPTDDEIVQAVLSSLTRAERDGGVAYLRVQPLAAGEAYPLSPAPIFAEHACRLAFVDPSPAANWGHACRYLTIDAFTLAVASHAARLPPAGLFGAEWRLVHRAPGVPDALVFAPNDERERS